MGLDSATLSAVRTIAAWRAAMACTHASAASVVTTSASATDTAVIAHATRRFSRSANCVRRGISASEMSNAGTTSAETLS